MSPISLNLRRLCRLSGDRSPVGRHGSPWMVPLVLARFEFTVPQFVQFPVRLVGGPVLSGLARLVLAVAFVVVLLVVVVMVVVTKSVSWVGGGTGVIGVGSGRRGTVLGDNTFAGMLSSQP